MLISIIYAIVEITTLDLTLTPTRRNPPYRLHIVFNIAAYGPPPTGRDTTPQIHVRPCWKFVEICVGTSCILLLTISLLKVLVCWSKWGGIHQSACVLKYMRWYTPMSLCAEMCEVVSTNQLMCWNIWGGIHQSACVLKHMRWYPPIRLCVEVYEVVSTNQVVCWSMLYYNILYNMYNSYVIYICIMYIWIFNYVWFRLLFSLWGAA